MDNLGHLGRPSAIIGDVVVAPHVQGHGIGCAMMAFARDISAAKRCYKLVLSSDARRTHAHSFYQSLGFERHGFSFALDLALALP